MHAQKRESSQEVLLMHKIIDNLRILEDSAQTRPHIQQMVDGYRYTYIDISMDRQIESQIYRQIDGLVKVRDRQMKKWRSSLWMKKGRIDRQKIGKIAKIALDRQLDSLIDGRMARNKENIFVYCGQIDNILMQTYQRIRHILTIGRYSGLD